MKKDPDLTSGRQKTHLQIWHGICSQVWGSGHIEDSLEQSPSQPRLAEWFDDPIRTDSILPVWWWCANLHSFYIINVFVYTKRNNKNTVDSQIEIH